MARGGEDGGDQRVHLIEVQLGEGGAPLQRHEAQLWVIVREGEKDERVFMKPVQLGQGRALARFTLAAQQLQEVTP